MGVYANGQLIYGFVHTDDCDKLFSLVQGTSEEEEEDYSFEEKHQDLQEKYHISLYHVGYGAVDIISAFTASANSKGFDVQPIKTEDLVKTEAYDWNIRAFLNDLNIDPDAYIPGWHILGYMD